ncbi:MAG: 1-acyl-sn-glycerol-3-phosphate acyltransferase [Candidatus Omnitrophica bacterium]|nr:1-acyl-sn-glycerol-3-phosphate acyltransferase [Candidatus Omnitrophota bacterium]MBU1905952.1 1-acyl-sn-glycerol-3-phosphate acyltransferase [Candidatus Omnitrophota bacterium]
MFYYIARPIVIAILKLIFRFKVEGLENLPSKTNFIVVANHSSYLDPVLVGAAIPRKIYWITMRSLFSYPWLRWLMAITRTLPTGEASKRAIDLLMKDKFIGIFPEGKRSEDGKLTEFRRGAALLAIKTGRPIVPCAILGGYDVLSKRTVFSRFARIKVKIGKPTFLSKEFTDVIDDLALQEGIFEVKNRIQEMMHAG